MIAERLREVEQISWNVLVCAAVADAAAAAASAQRSHGEAAASCFTKTPQHRGKLMSLTACTGGCKYLTHCVERKSSPLLYRGKQISYTVQRESYVP